MSSPSSSSFSMADVERRKISARDLAQRIRADPAGVAVVDVRDDDYLGGHIRGCHNMPGLNHSGHFESMYPTLRRKVGGCGAVVFHCMKSQIRGPKSALNYLRKREEEGLTDLADGDGKEGKKAQEVLVLEDGWEGWMREFKNDEGLTEGYRKEVWEWM